MYWGVCVCFVGTVVWSRRRIRITQSQQVCLTHIVRFVCLCDGLTHYVCVCVCVSSSFSVSPSDENIYEFGFDEDFDVDVPIGQCKALYNYNGELTTTFFAFIFYLFNWCDPKTEHTIRPCVSPVCVCVFQVTVTVLCVSRRASSWRWWWRIRATAGPEFRGQTETWDMCPLPTSRSSDSNFIRL